MKLLKNKIKKILQKVVFKFFPKKFHLPLYFFYFKKFKHLEPEMFFIENILTSNKRFLDIGSNLGIYSYYFRKKFRYINAFEPLKEVSYGLKALNCKNIKVHNLAISNHKGELTLHVPMLYGSPSSGLASLEKRDLLSQDRLVSIDTIDSFSFDDVSLIKIDVEGHELSVLRGSIETINRCKPVIIVEIEQRHNKLEIEDVFSEFLDLNYDGYFLIQNKLKSIDEFIYTKHQKNYLEDPSNNFYINNFIFIPKV